MKKFTGVILGVLILCSASVANAANEHSEKAEHFSMLELSRKLSALILERYPNAHIDSDAFSINACDSHFTKDASVDNHSCLESQLSRVLILPISHYVFLWVLMPHINRTAVSL